ncbi:MAG: lysophospholipid acyltransferase family protein [Desulfobacteraceae bacterium]|jgi:lysophospholipid acyltransferase (LPLAT)-like uncharacterized protein|nr:lysophospholipid acyltransferase family protein [Desulfobacteraceae bacterium]
MAPALRRFLASKFFITALYHFIRLYGATFRLQVVNQGPWQDHLAGGGRVLLCCWHQQFFSFIRHFSGFRRYRPSLMISRSADGSMIAGVAERSGWRAVRGSSSRDGRRALVQMIANLRQSGLAAHILDGPRGPAGVVKSGAIVLAAEAGALIVPVYTESAQRWIFHSWDRFLLPKPFSRVTIRFGAPLRIDTQNGADGAIEDQRLALEAVMRPALF